MNTMRTVIASMLVALTLVASLPTVSLAQQPAPQPPPPVLMPDVVKEDEGPGLSRFDLYTVGAGVFTVARLPFNIALCAIGVGVGTALFAATLGSGYRATTRVLEEGCAQKWFVRSKDIRPLRGTSGIFEARMDRYQER
jgi:hypothetical protein